MALLWGVFCIARICLAISSLDWYNKDSKNSKRGEDMEYSMIDSHAHYDDEQFEKDRDKLLTILPEVGIGLVVNVGASMESCKSTIALTKKYPHVYGALGVHPGSVEELNEDRFVWLSQAVRQEKIVAVGEIGLDYYYDEPDRQLQKDWFARQISLAADVGLPMIIHSREAAQDTYDIMHSLGCEDVGGVIHCFSYSVEMARKFLDMGFYLGLGGVVTFKNARTVKEVAAYAPMDRIVLETDCPYLSPVPYRGKRNSSLNLPYVAEAIAQIRDMDVEEVCRVTSENVRALYRLDS